MTDCKQLTLTLKRRNKIYTWKISLNPLVFHFLRKNETRGLDLGLWCRMGKCLDTKNDRMFDTNPFEIKPPNSIVCFCVCMFDKKILGGYPLPQKIALSVQISH